MKKIVIVGGGLAGLEVAKELSGNESFEVLLIDKNNYNFFPPLLYQVSTAFIEASNISYPFRRLFQKYKNIDFFMGDFIRLIPEQNIVETDTGNVPYDYLILSMGTETNFFGNENIARNALPMKTIDDAINLRNHILLCLEEASRSTALLDKEKLVNVVIAGGGPTGVELAGMLGEMRKYIGPKDYRTFDQVLGNVYLVNSGPTLLAPMSRKAQENAFKVLTDLGIKVLLNTLVKDYVNDTVLLSNGDSIPAKTLIWASGVVARPVRGLSSESVGPAGRIIVDEINQVKGYDNIFAIGDQCILFSDNNYPKGHPQLAQVAIQQGRQLGRNLIRQEEHKSLKPFAYLNKGSMAIISKHKAVVDMPRGSFKGFIAWLVWLFIHIIPLISFRNKSKLAASWLYSFMTNDPTLRLIIRPKLNNESTSSQVAKPVSQK